MHRLFIVLALACAALAQETFPCAAVRETPFGKYCFENSDYTGRVRGINPSETVPPPPVKPRFVPTFLAAPYVESTLTGDKFALDNRNFATRETAEWMAKRFGAKVEARTYNYSLYKVSDAELWLVWTDGTAMNAGWAAVPYLSPGVSEESCEAYVVYRIEAGRAEQRKFMEKRAHGPTLPPDPWVPIKA
jgi:hypothetical protein